MIGNEEVVVLFGGRGIDKDVIQQPTTYRIEEIDGRPEVIVYEGHPVTKPYSYEASEENSTTTGILTPVFELFNDVWVRLFFNLKFISFFKSLILLKLLNGNYYLQTFCTVVV